jgi:drug/metabolite transporter (DMT)-like permease
MTGIAPYIGPRLTGLLTTIPLYAGILTIFAHRHHGHAGANSVLRGLILGLFSFAGFYLVLGLLIQNTSLLISFGLATLSALIVQGATLLIIQKPNQHNS